MRRMIAAGVVILTGCASAGQMPVEERNYISEKYDKFTQLREIYMTDLRVNSNSPYPVYLRLQYPYNDKIREPALIVTRQYSGSPTNRWYTFPSVYLIVDGSSPIELERGYPDLKLDGMFFRESVAYVLPDAVLQRLVNAQSIEGRVIDTEFVVPHTVIVVLHDFGNRLRTGAVSGSK